MNMMQSYSCCVTNKCKFRDADKHVSAQNSGEGSNQVLRCKGSWVTIAYGSEQVMGMGVALQAHTLPLGQPVCLHSEVFDLRLLLATGKIIRDLGVQLRNSSHQLL